MASLGKKMKSSRDEKLADYVAPQVGEIIHLIRARKTRDNCSTILGFDMRRLKSLTDSMAIRYLGISIESLTEE